MDYKITKENKISWVILGIAFAFMLCVFAPLDAYFANKDEFWFSLGQFLPIVAATFLIVAVVISLIGLVFSKWNKVFFYLFVIVLGAFVYLYIQGNYIPRNYGVLNGESIDWNSYIGYAMASIVLLIVVIALSILLATKLKAKLFDIGKYAALFVFLIQIVTLSTVLLQNNMAKDTNNQDTNRIVSQDKMFNLSPDSNIIVFLLDSFQADDFSLLMNGEQKEEYQELFSNFVYYPDTLGMYPTTRASLPYILTGVAYQNEVPYSEYVANAYENNPIYEAIEKNDYSNGVYTNSMYMGSENDMYENVSEGNYSISSYSQFASKLYKLVAFNYMPHQLKKIFFTDTSEFERLKKSNDGKVAFSSDVISFDNSLKATSLSVDEKKRCFRFYHLDGVHAPYTFGEDLISQSGVEYNEIDEAKGNFNLLASYFDALKQNGIYDNSTIIILSDHGHTTYSQNPLFLMKNAGEKHEFEVSDASMSFEYLDDIFIKLINGENVEEDTISTMRPENGEFRRFLYYTWDNAWDRGYLPGMQEFYSTGFAGDENAMCPTGQYYSADNADYSYKLGTKLDFLNGNNGYLYCKYGTGYGRGAYGNVCQKALFEFDLKGKYKNILTAIKLNSVSGCGNVDVYVNDNLVGEFYYGGKDKLEFIIPNEYINDDKISMMLIQTMQKDDPQSSITESKMNLDQMILTSTDEEMNPEQQNQAFVYEPGTVLDAQNGIVQFAMNGVCDFDGSSCWTSSKSASFIFKIPSGNQDMNLHLEFITFDGDQTVGIIVNDEKIDEFVANGQTKKDIAIPAKLIESGTVQVTLDLPDARSPQSLGQSTDARELALSLIQVVLK